MPTYQYTCTACQQPLEAVQSFSDAALTECPACGGRLRKVYGAVGVVFKGSGFYKNDSRSESKGSSSGEAKPAASGDGASATPATPAATPSSTPATPAKAAPTTPTASSSAGKSA